MRDRCNDADEKEIAEVACTRTVWNRAGVFALADSAIDGVQQREQQQWEWRRHPGWHVRSDRNRQPTRPERSPWRMKRS